MKSTQNYSIDIEILKEFNECVPAQSRSAVIEALITEFLIIDSERGDATPQCMIHAPNLPEKEIP